MDGCLLPAEANVSNMLPPLMIGHSSRLRFESHARAHARASFNACALASAWLYYFHGNFHPLLLRPFFFFTGDLAPNEQVQQWNSGTCRMVPDFGASAIGMLGQGPEHCWGY